MHLERLERQLDETRAAVTSLRALLQPTPTERVIEHRTVPPTSAAAITDPTLRSSPTHEEVRMPAYIVITKEHTRDAAESQRYLAQHDAFIEGHALTYRARFGRHETLEGAAAEGIAILEFPTYDEAKRWYQSAAYQEASKHRYLGGDYRAILVAGVEP